MFVVSTSYEVHFQMTMIGRLIWVYVFQICNKDTPYIGNRPVQRDKVEESTQHERIKAIHLAFKV